MSTPFQIIWSDEFNNVLTSESFAICFPGVTSQAKNIQVTTNATTLQTFETLVDVAFFLTGDTNDINTVQNIWPTLGGSSNLQFNGGIDISFDGGQTFTRFDSTHGVKATPSTWIPLPSEAIGLGAIDQTLGAFDTAHFIVRYIIPPGATQFGKLNISLSLGFDII
jgi:hypothetical protein